MKTTDKTIAGVLLGFGFYKYIHALHHDEHIGLALAFLVLGMTMYQRARKRSDNLPAPAPEEQEGPKRNGISNE